MRNVMKLQPPWWVSGQRPDITGVNMEIIVKFNGDIYSIAQRTGAQVELLKQDYAILDIPRENIEMLYEYAGIEDIELPKRLFLGTTYNLTSSCIRTVQDSYRLSGSGVVVAVIDSGIDYSHPDFRNDDGTTRILFLWDQTIPGNPPEGFAEGTEYTQSEINNALQEPDPFLIVPSRDFIGHGTAVAGIAAGNGGASSGENTGAAPRASIIAVKVGRGEDSFALSTDLMRAVKYVIDKSRELAMPAAINLSFGMNDGSHKGNSLFEEYLTDMADEWKISIVVPTGNEGSAGHHHSGRLSTNNTIETEFFTAAGLDRFYLSLWKNFADSFAVELIFPDGYSSGVINIESQVKTVRNDNAILTVIYGQPGRYSIDQEIFFDIRSINDTIKPGLWRLRIIPSVIVDGNYDIWLPTLEEVGTQTYFTDPSIYNTMTIPSTANKVIRVSGYNDRLGSIAGFSGTGRSDEPLFMPDVAAPAVNIISARSGGGYDSFTGTSFAAPFVTGSAALMMQWGIVEGNAPFMYGERIRGFLRLGANRTQGLSYPNPTFGYGRLCLANSLEYMRRYKWGGDQLWRII